MELENECEFVRLWNWWAMILQYRGMNDICVIGEKLLYSIGFLIYTALYISVHIHNYYYI